MNTVYNYDFIEYQYLVEDDSVDLAIFDPPYGINYKAWDKINFRVFTEIWVDIMVRKLKSTGSAWIFMGRDNLFTHAGCERGLVNILEQYGHVNLDNWVVWARQKGRGSSKHLKSQREDIIHFTMSKEFTWNPLKMLREVVTPYIKDGKPRGWFLDEHGNRVRWTGLGNVWTYSAPFWKSIDDPSIHPAQKPILLVDRLVRLSSNEGDMILDGFSGSGVVTRAAKKNKRNSIAFEKDEEIYVKSLDLINKDYEGGVYEMS